MIRSLLIIVVIVTCGCSSRRQAITASLPTTLPIYNAVSIKTPPKIDGLLDDDAWKRSAWSTVFVNTVSGIVEEPKTRAKIAWDNRHIYFAADITDTWLKSTYLQRDDHLWEQDCFEMMFDPGGDGKNYFEIQVAPTNQVFDTRYDSRRVPQPFGHVDWNATINARAVTRGQVNDSNADGGYTVEVAITLASFANTPPISHGTMWRINMYVLDATAQGQRAVGWSPPLVGDFHIPERFGKVVFDRLEK